MVSYSTGRKVANIYTIDTTVFTVQCCWYHTGTYSAVFAEYLQYSKQYSVHPIAFAVLQIQHGIYYVVLKVQYSSTTITVLVYSRVLQRGVTIFWYLVFATKALRFRSAVLCCLSVLYSTID